MCEPTTIVALTTAVVSAVTAVHQGRQQVKAIEAEQKVEAENIATQASIDTNARLSEARELRATARASAAEAAVSGNSLAAQEMQIEQGVGTDMAMIESGMRRNLDTSARSANARSKLARAEATGSVLSSAASAGLGVYGQYAGKNMTISNKSGATVNKSKSTAGSNTKGG